MRKVVCGKISVLWPQEMGRSLKKSKPNQYVDHVESILAKESNTTNLFQYLHELHLLIFAVLTLFVFQGIKIHCTPSWKKTNDCILS